MAFFAPTVNFPCADLARLSAASLQGLPLAAGLEEDLDCWLARSSGLTMLAVVSAEFTARTLTTSSAASFAALCGA